MNVFCLVLEGFIYKNSVVTLQAIKVAFEFEIRALTI
jgi:hypothetical protein